MASSNSTEQRPKIYKINDLKSRILRPAFTSTYGVRISTPSLVAEYLEQNKILNDTELLEISCCEASIPGSSFATIDTSNDFMGVSTKNAYRRLYDDRADFTFYVNHNHEQIKYFEYWMRYIVGEQDALDIEKSNFVSRVQYPDNYKTKIYLLKFEKDYPANSSNVMVYNFVDAFPISINSIPVSYESSSLLKMTVSFSYSRYHIGKQRELSSDTSSATSDIYSGFTQNLTTTNGINPFTAATSGSRISIEDAYSGKFNLNV